MKSRRINIKGVKQLFSLKGEPKVVAKGFALGSFVGMLPFPGFQMIISAALASFLRVNRTAAIAGVFNTNLATGVFVFAFNYWLGTKLLGLESNFQMPERLGFGFIGTVLNAGTEVFFALLVGGIITGIPAMFLGYYISLLLLKNKRESNVDK